MDARKADFKRGIDGDEARRRRDDTQVSIRKNKREDQLGMVCLAVMIAC